MTPTTPTPRSRQNSHILRFASLAIITSIWGACNEAPITEAPNVAPVTDTTTSSLDGPQVIHTQDGGRMEGMLLNNERQGAWVSYFPHGGIKSRATFVDGIQQGATEVFHENGMTFYTGQYSNGKRTGLWVFYDRNGDQERTARYDSLGTLLEQK